MKRLFTMVITLCVMTFWGAYTSEAKGLGVTAGASFLNLRSISVDATTGYHAGLTYQFNLPFKFTIQPSLVYHMKSSVVEDVIENATPIDIKTGYLELPVSLQWGPDLILFRPFVDVTPFIGYGLNKQVTGGEVTKSSDKWDGWNRFEYGLGLGIGLDVWRLQIIGRYNWNFGSLVDADGNFPTGNDVLSNMKSVFQGNNYGGVTLSVSFMF